MLIELVQHVTLIENRDQDSQANFHFKFIVAWAGFYQIKIFKYYMCLMSKCSFENSLNLLKPVFTTK